MTLAKEVQPPRLRLQYRALQIVGCLAILLAFVAWASAFTKQLEEADEQARDRIYEMRERERERERVRDLERFEHDTRRWARRPECPVSVLPDWER